MYHNNGKINENELDDVSGGGCQTYSKDDPNYLIVSSLNSCDGYEERKPYPVIGIDGTCGTCQYVRGSNGFTFYCKIRTKDNDPYK